MGQIDNLTLTMQNWFMGNVEDMFHKCIYSNGHGSIKQVSCKPQTHSVEGDLTDLHESAKLMQYNIEGSFLSTVA